MTWTFQLLLAVFCSEMDDINSPIVENTFIREEKALMYYPFEYSVMMGDPTMTSDSPKKFRHHGSGKFIEHNDGQSMQFITELFESEPMEYLFIEAIVSRDKLIRS